MHTLWWVEEQEDENQDSSSDGYIAAGKSAPAILRNGVIRVSEMWKNSHIQKHQRQVTYSVNAPPMTGPMQTLTAKVLVTMLMQSGRFLSLTVWVMMTRDPWNKPAAPAPATARPTMKTADDGAAAQRMEPTVTCQL